VTVPGTRGHSFSLPVTVRQPTERHPDSGTACPTCEHVYGRHEGVKTGRGFVLGHAEIARLFLRVGEGMSLRAASQELRESVFRGRPAGQRGPSPRSRAEGRTWLGHEWSAAVYGRTLSGSGCPDCYRLEAAERSKAGKQRAREARERPPDGSRYSHRDTTELARPEGFEPPTL